MRTTSFSTLSFATLALLLMSAQSVWADECDINPQNCTQFVLPGQTVDVDDNFVCADGDCKTYLKVAPGSPYEKSYENTKLITGAEVNAKNNSDGGNGTITGSSRLDAACSSYLKGSDNASETARKMCGGAGNGYGEDSSEVNNGKYPDVGGEGILWKPVSDSNGNLVILLNRSYGNPKVELLSPDGDVIETGDFAYYSNPDRATYRFNKPGGSYPDGTLVRVGGKTFAVPNTSKRYE